MKIAIASDLHLEFQDIDLKNADNAQVLILSGDIMIAENLYKYDSEMTNSCWDSLPNPNSKGHLAIRFREFLQRCSVEFPHVVYVAGNHEFYHGRWNASIDHLRNECAKFSNVHFLECDTKVIDDVTFVGATLWTDMNKGDPLTQHAIKDMMNDFKAIRHDGLGYTALRPVHVIERHKKTLEYLKIVLANMKDNKVAMVGHHAPSKMSTHPKYKHEMLMNGGYSSDLSEFIMDHPQIKLWTHGHTHDPFDYMIGETRIVCNPRGYQGWDPQADLFELKFLDI